MEMTAVDNSALFYCFGLEGLHNRVNQPRGYVRLFEKIFKIGLAERSLILVRYIFLRLAPKMDFGMDV